MISSQFSQSMSVTRKDFGVVPQGPGLTLGTTPPVQKLETAPDGLSGVQDQVAFQVADPPTLQSSADSMAVAEPGPSTETVDGVDDIRQDGVQSELQVLDLGDYQLLLGDVPILLVKPNGPLFMQQPGPSTSYANDMFAGSSMAVPQVPESSGKSFLEGMTLDVESTRDACIAFMADGKFPTFDS